MTREIRFYKNYFIDFYIAQDEKVQEKIDYVLNLIKTVEGVPEKFMKHIKGTDGLYEVRIKYQNGVFRIFCCFDEGKIIILFNAFKKKTMKTPRKEIERGLKLKQEYFLNKQGENHENIK